MSLQIGIVGLPNVGKSTLFNALTGGSALAANYPFATIEPNTGIVPIPDSRLEALAKLYEQPRALRSDGMRGADEQRSETYMKYDERTAQSATKQSAENASGVAGSAGQQAGAAQWPRVIPATIQFVDIAGLVKGAAEGQGLGNQFLAHIREVDAICHVVRAFEKGDVTHVESTVEPERDIGIINTELILADIQTAQKNLPVLEKQTKTDPKSHPDLAHLREILATLNQGKALNQTELLDPKKLEPLSQPYQTFVRQLITSKPVIYVFNVGEETLADSEQQTKLHSLVDPSPSLCISAELEAKLVSLSSEDRHELLSISGAEATGLERLAALAYRTLGLQSFLTAGPKEVRAWTIPSGATAPEAAGVIHTDFRRGFIAAEVVNFDDLVTIGSRQAAKAQGKVRTEGKTYLMQEGDVVEFRFNV